jgi:hypothetical protein
VDQVADIAHAVPPRGKESATRIVRAEQHLVARATRRAYACGSLVDSHPSRLVADTRGAPGAGELDTWARRRDWRLLSLHFADVDRAVHFVKAWRAEVNDRPAVPWVGWVSPAYELAVAVPVGVVYSR